jgi:hypothetical protein
MGFLERELIVHFKRNFARVLAFFIASRVSGPACFKVTPSVMARRLAFFIASRVSEMGFVFGLGPSSPSAARSLRDLPFFELQITDYELRMGFLERELIVHFKRNFARVLAFFIAARVSEQGFVV